METTYQINSLDVDFAQKYIVAGCDDNKVRLFTLEEGKMVINQELSGHSSNVTKAVFVKGGNFIISADYSGVVFVWKLGTLYELKKEKQVYKGIIMDVDVRSKDDSFIVYCACADGVLRTLTFDSYFNIKEDSETLCKQNLTSVSCNKSYIAVGSADSSVFLGTSSLKPYKYCDSTVNCVSVNPSNSSVDMVFSSGHDNGSLFINRLVDNSLMKQEIKLDGPIQSCKWSVDGFTLSVGFGDGQIKSFIPDVNNNYEEVVMTGKE